VSEQILSHRQQSLFSSLIDNPKKCKSCDNPPAPAMYGFCSMVCRTAKPKSKKEARFSLCAICGAKFEVVGLKKTCGLNCSKKYRKQNITEEQKKRRLDKRKEEYKKNQHSREKAKAYAMAWAAENKEAVRQIADKWRAKKYQEDPQWRSKERKIERAKARGMTLDEYQAHCEKHTKKREGPKEQKAAPIRSNHSQHYREWQKHQRMDAHIEAYKRKKSNEKALRSWHAICSTPEGLLWARMKTRLRQVVKRAIGDDKAHSVTCSRLGYKPADLLARLISTMPEGASIADFFNGALHIDHIRPCASFDLSDPAQVIEAYSLANLQLLWARDNLVKNSKWNGKIIRRRRIDLNNDVESAERHSQPIGQGAAR
jgi:hypothetical protein